ncbi:MAG TPA: hypothetical protein VF329_13460 [Gammaproteobacteria bacterium]
MSADDRSATAARARGSDRTRNDAGRAPRRAPIWVAIGFLLAFAATVLTVVLTGLYVRAPRGSEAERARAPVEEPAGGEERADRADRSEAQ